MRLIAAGLILVALAVILVPGPARADATVPVATQADAIPEPAASTDIYKPPPRGAPANRVGAATRDLSRVALVIGNGAYQHLPRLENPADDARLIATRLQSVGFQLVGGEAQTDLDRAGLERAIRPFGDSIAFWPKEPSPCRQMTWVPGLAALAPTANGKPTPHRAERPGIQPGRGESRDRRPGNPEFRASVVRFAGCIKDYSRWVHLIAAMLRGGFTMEEAGKVDAGNYLRRFGAPRPTRRQPRALPPVRIRAGKQHCPAPAGLFLASGIAVRR